jgi:mycofactocin precursor
MSAFGASILKGRKYMMNENDKEIRENEPNIDEKKPDGLDEIEEIVIEELAVDGICGIY